MKRTALAVSTFTLLAAMAAFAQTTGQKSFDTMKSLSGNWEGKDSMGGAVEIAQNKPGQPATVALTGAPSAVACLAHVKDIRNLQCVDL